jgi:inner membrane protein
VDNITHTLVGACLAEAGLKRRTGLAAATLMIGANFPDIDVVAVPLGMGIEWRRGATHGFLALIILPFVLAEIMMLWDKHMRRRKEPDATPADYRQLVMLSAIAIATHPTLDFMNSYGMRWLMPFVDKWFYADGLFIVDLWVMLALLSGMLLARRARDVRPARTALLAVAIYTTGMLIITGVGRAQVAAAYPGQRFMVEPNGSIPWRRDVLIEDATSYRTASYSLFRGIRPVPMGWPKGDQDPAIAQAREHPKVQAFLRWARFPMYNVTRQGARTVVWVGDARYEGAQWASVQVALP